MSYRRITHEDRLLIKAYLDAGLNQSEIANKLGFHKSAICREIGRNSGKRGYRPKQAQRLAESRQQYRFIPRKLVPQMIERIEEKLRLKWSPEQISNRFEHEGLPTVATETIYRHIYSDRGKGGELWRHLRWSRRQRKRRFPSEERRGKIQNATPISERPKGANKRKKRGHWERDTMIGKNRKTAILALVDRKTRFNRFARLNRRLAPGVTNKTIALLSGLPCRSITNDRGQEFSDHERLARKLKVKVYFCDPYSSYQRGTNENRIGILRQYFPKKTDLSDLHWKTLKKVELEINNRPMKCLDWRTPYEAMMGKSCTAVV
jgi:IS30 family transposase